MNVHARQTAVQTAFAAALMLIYGWYVSPQGITTSDLYNSSIDVFRWTLRIGGLAMIVASAVCFLGLRTGLLLDFVVTGICGAVMLGVGAIGLFASGAPGLQDVLVLVFGVIFLRAAWTSWVLFGEVPIEAVPPPPVAVVKVVAINVIQPLLEAVPPTPPEPETAHPASLRPSSLPKDGEPPPADGYLAALSKENEEPPTASYE